MFSIFDPSVYFFSFSWVIMFIPLFFFVNHNFMLEFQLGFLQLSRVFSLKEINQLLKNKDLLYSIFVSLFFVLLIMNLSSMVPLIFPLTAHLSLVIPISLLFWFSPILISWFNSPSFFMKTLVPQGTPPFLLPFMVIIELTSLLIRPVTLSVRLVANITAGHLLLSILVSFILSLSFSFFHFLPILLMNVLELGVSLIQSYVFIILITMYTTEI